MSLYRCPGCRQYSSESNGELSGVTYFTRRFYDSYEGKDEQDEVENTCSDCGTDVEEFDEIDSSHVDRLQRKLNMPLDEIAKYLNNFRL